MSNNFARWVARSLVAGCLIAGAVVIGMGSSSATTTPAPAPAPVPATATANGSPSWIGN